MQASWKTKKSGQLASYKYSWTKNQQYGVHANKQFGKVK